MAGKFGKKGQYVASQFKYFQYHHLGNPFKRLRPIPQLIQGLVPMGALGMLHAPPSSAKSFLAKAMACSVATGLDFFGRKTIQGASLYVLSEGYQGMLHRLSAWALVNNRDLTDDPIFLSEPTNNFRMLDEAEISNQQKKDANGNNDGSVPQDVVVEKAIDSLVSAIEEIEEKTGETLKLLVLDHYSQLLGGNEDKHSENSAATANLFAKYCKEKIINRKSKIQGLEEYPVSTTVLLIAHNAYAARRARGSSALPAAMDFILMTELDETTGEFQLSVEKQKDLPVADDSYFLLREVKVATWIPDERDRAAYQAMGVACPDSEDIFSATIESSNDLLMVKVAKDRDGHQLHAIDVLREVGVAIATDKNTPEDALNSARSANWKSFKIFIANLNISTETGHQVLRICVARGLIEKTPKRIYQLTDLAIDLMLLSDAVIDGDVGTE